MQYTAYSVIVGMKKRFFFFSSLLLLFVFVEKSVYYGVLCIVENVNGRCRCSSIVLRGPFDKSVNRRKGVMIDEQEREMVHWRKKASKYGEGRKRYTYNIMQVVLPP